MPKTELTPPTILRTEDVEIEKLQPDENELGRHSPEQSANLGQDMLANGQLQPIAVTEDLRVIFGHGRLLGARAAGMKTLRANFYAKSLANLQFRLIRAAENLQRNELTPYRKWLLCAEMLKLHGCDQQTLAGLLHQSPASITKAMSPSKTTEAWQAALKDGKVSLSDTEVAARLPPDQQEGLLALKLSSPGMNREQLGQAAKKVVAPQAETVKLSRVTCALAGGVKVTVAGSEIDLEGLIEVLGSALDAAKRAKRDSIDLRTAERVWRDKSRSV